MSSDWGAIRKDLSLRPVEGVDGTASEGEILSVYINTVSPDHRSCCGEPVNRFANFVE